MARAGPLVTVVQTGERQGGGGKREGADGGGRGERERERDLF